MITAMTVGSFATLHSDHIELFGWMENFADHVIVGINSSELIRKRKGFDPDSYVTRVLDIKDHLPLGDFFRFDGGSLYCKLEQFRPTFLVIGSDYHDKNYLDLIEVSTADRHRFGTSLVYKPTLERIHSSELRGK